MQQNVPPLLAAHNIHFAYPGHPPVLAGANLHLYPKQKLALLGDNAAGKSTLLHILTGLLPPNTGTVLWQENACTKEADFALMRQGVGYLLQNSDEQLFCESVLEDVAFAPQNYGFSKQESITVARQALATCGVLHLQEKSIYALSGGEKKLVALAGILAQKPQVLLLDEPTNMLDANTQKHVTEILCTLPQAMIVIAHHEKFIQKLCNTSLYLQGGILQEKDTPCAMQDVQDRR